MDVFKLSPEAARLADRRVRIVREKRPNEPAEQFDLAFKKADDDLAVRLGEIGEKLRV